MKSKQVKRESLRDSSWRLSLEPNNEKSELPVNPKCKNPMKPVAPKPKSELSTSPIMKSKYFRKSTEPAPLPKKPSLLDNLDLEIPDLVDSDDDIFDTKIKVKKDPKPSNFDMLFSNNDTKQTLTIKKSPKKQSQELAPRASIAKVKGSPKSQPKISNFFTRK